MLPFNISEVCGLVGVAVPPHRDMFEVKCPNCEGDRFNIDIGKQVCHCMRCGCGGGMTALFSIFTGVPSKEAFGVIVDRLGRGKSSNKTGSGKSDEWTKFQVPAPKVALEMPVAPIEKRDETYQRYIRSLTLADDHRKALRKRGMSNAEIDWLEYRTMPMTGHKLIVEGLLLAGSYLKGVPGFFIDKNNRWTIKYQQRGILIPVRDLQGNIQGLQIRLDKAEHSSGKFRWISSVGKESGCGALTWAHFAGSWKSGDTEIYLTEGPVKADIFYLITRKPIIAIPGVSSIDEAIKMLTELKAKGLKKVHLALDMDYMDMIPKVTTDGEVIEEVKQVYKDYARLITRITDLGLTYSRSKWPREFKGIDDFLAAKVRGVK